MTEKRLKEITDRFPEIRIAVIGDFFLDKYLDTDPRIMEHSVESGKNAHQVMAIRHSPGAAGTAVENLASLDAGKIHTIGIVGDDGEAYDLFHDLHDMGCITDGLVRAPDRMTPTYLKPRNLTDPSLTGEHERYDTKNRSPSPPEYIQQVIEYLDKILPELKALIISDQVEMDNCGVITEEVRNVLADRALRCPDVKFVADSRTHIRSFRNVIIKPNEFETVGWENPMPGEKVDDGELAAAVVRLAHEVNAPVCTTRGSRGMFVSDPEPTAVRGVRLDGPLDITGAGDSALAAFTLSLASGAQLPEAALIGNLVASITVQQLATTGTAARDELPGRLDLWCSQAREKL